MLLLLAGWLWTRSLASQAEELFPPIGELVEVGGLRLHYLDRGEGQPIVMLHGAFGGLHDWQAHLFPWVAQHHRAIAIDRPGHGYSEPPHGDASPIVQARLIHGLLEQLGVERPLLVGFSWGATTSLAYALEYPGEVAGLVLVNGAYYPWPGGTSPLFWIPSIPLLGEVLAHTVVMPIGSYLARWSIARAFHPDRPPPSFERHSPLPLALRPESYVHNAEQMNHLGDYLTRLSPRWSEVSVPVEIVYGTHDRIASPDIHSKALAEVLPNAEVIAVTRGSHQLPYTHPEIIREAVLSISEK